jgi:hypothetical protein
MDAGPISTIFKVGFLVFLMILKVCENIPRDFFQRRHAAYQREKVEINSMIISDIKQKAEVSFGRNQNSRTWTVTSASTQINCPAPFSLAPAMFNQEITPTI